MKKKYLNIVLVIILVVIWGSIIKKYFGKEEVGNDIVTLSTSVSNHSYDNVTNKDSFKLILTNKNPFKATTTKKTYQLNSNASVVKAKTIKKDLNTSIVWPKISYHGFVKGNDKKTKLVILKVNNRLYRKREKEKIEGLLVIRAFEDSLVISNKKERKTIMRIR